MKIFGISMVRNEADVVRLSILHHLSLGLDTILVVDNESSDGTARILQDLSRRHPVKWRKDSSIWAQDEVFTELAREAHAAGASWVVPFDADEFWWSPSVTLKEALPDGVGALRAQVVNFIQRRDRKKSAATSLLTMTRRVQTPVGPPDLCQELVQSRRIAFVEMMYPPKFLVRTAASVRMSLGNHEVEGITGPIQDTDQFLCLHAPLRSRNSLYARVEQGRRTEQAGWPSDAGWHVRRWTQMYEESGLDEEWRANSYDAQGIDVFGARHNVVYDPTLRNLVEPFIQPFWRRVLPFGSRSA